GGVGADRTRDQAVAGRVRRALDGLGPARGPQRGLWPQRRQLREQRRAHFARAGRGQQHRGETLAGRVVHGVGLAAALSHLGPLSGDSLAPDARRGRDAGPALGPRAASGAALGAAVQRAIAARPCRRAIRPQAIASTIACPTRKDSTAAPAPIPSTARRSQPSSAARPKPATQVTTYTSSVASGRRSSSLRPRHHARTTERSAGSAPSQPRPASTVTWA